MKATPAIQPSASPTPMPRRRAALPGRRSGLVQRCACGKGGGPAGACAECRKKRLQPRLRIGAVDDPLEREADRAAAAVANDSPMPALSSAATAAQTMQRACCCCAQSIDITGGGLYRRDGRVGHDFEVPITLRYGAGEGTADGASDCTMEWRERTSKTSALLPDTDRWIDVFPLARHHLIENPEDRIPLLEKWDGRARTCGSDETIGIPDDPYIDAKQWPNATRTLDFDLVVRSGQGCACAHDELHAYARQQLHLINGAPFMGGIRFEKRDAEPSWPPGTATPTPEAAPAAPLYRKAQPGVSQTAEAPARVHAVLAEPGRALASDVRGRMEARFGYDFGHVRIHDDARAAHSAAAVQAHAYTVGHDVVFGAGAFAPQTTAGQRLLAHELAHVVQQGGGAQGVQQGATTVQRKPKPGAPIKDGWFYGRSLFDDRHDAPVERRTGHVTISQGSTFDAEAIHGLPATGDPSSRLPDVPFHPPTPTSR